MGDRVEAVEIPAEKTIAIRDEHDLRGVADIFLFIAILCFSAVAILALALAAPLAVAATGVAGALSAMTARGAKKGGWRAAGA